MDLIDLRNVSDLTGIDINMVDTNTLAPEMEPNRQLYFMAKSREYVKRKSEELGRNLTVHITTFGCQMNAKDSEKLLGILEKIGYEETDDEKAADFLIMNTCTVRENANQKVYGHLGMYQSRKKKAPHRMVAICGCMSRSQMRLQRFAAATVLLILYLELITYLSLQSCYIRHLLKKNR